MEYIDELKTVYGSRLFQTDEEAARLGVARLTAYRKLFDVAYLVARPKTRWTVDREVYELATSVKKKDCWGVLARLKKGAIRAKTKEEEEQLDRLERLGIVVSASGWDYREFVKLYALSESELPKFRGVLNAKFQRYGYKPFLSPHMNLSACVDAGALYCESRDTITFPYGRRERFVYSFSPNIPNEILDFTTKEEKSVAEFASYFGRSKIWSDDPLVLRVSEPFQDGRRFLRDFLAVAPDICDFQGLTPDMKERRAFVRSQHRKGLRLYKTGWRPAILNRQLLASGGRDVAADG